MNEFGHNPEKPNSPPLPEQVMSKAEQDKLAADTLEGYVGQTARLIRGRRGLETAGLTPAEQEAKTAQALRLGLSEAALDTLVEQRIAELDKEGNALEG